MRFDQFVHKYTRAVFIFIVIVMVIPLVLWGYMGDTQEEDGGVSAGTYQSPTRGTVNVSEGQLTQQRRRAVPGYWWKKYNDRMTLILMMRAGRPPEPPKDEDIEKQAWENIVLLQDARDKGIAASEQETFVKIRSVYDYIRELHGLPREPAIDNDILQKIIRDIFHTTEAVFRDWAGDLVVLDKLLETVSESEFADYDRVYDQVLRQDQLARVWYTAFDPKDFSRETRPPTPDEILKHYEQNKPKFRTPEKARVSYLLADLEAFKKKLPDPTEDQIKQYYKDNERQFEEEHKHSPGEEHKEDEKRQVKPLDQVRGEVVSKIKQRDAEKQADELMNKVNVELGAAAAANQGKYPEGILETLKEKFAKEGSELVFSNTAAFAQKGVDEVEKEVGTGSQLSFWAFDPAVKDGEIGQKVKTSKGVVLFRLDSRKAGGDLGVTEAVRESIVKELQKEQVKRRTAAKASNVVQEITAKGLAGARAEKPLDWKVTRYFKLQGGDTGIEDRGLSFAISQQVARGTAKPGVASVLSGQSVGREFADWSYVVYVEDLVSGPPQDSEERFRDARRRENDAARRKYKDEYIGSVMAQAKCDPVNKKIPDAPKTR